MSKLMQQRNNLIAGNGTAKDLTRIILVSNELKRLYHKRMGTKSFQFDDVSVAVDLLLRRITLGQGMGKMLLREPIFNRVTPSPRQHNEMMELVDKLEGEFPGKWRQEWLAFEGKPDKVCNVVAVSDAESRRRNRARVAEIGKI